MPVGALGLVQARRDAMRHRFAAAVTVTLIVGGERWSGDVARRGPQSLPCQAVLARCGAGEFNVEGVNVDDAITAPHRSGRQQ